MTEAERLILLKKDLQRLTPANDDYLKFLLRAAEANILREGIKLDEGIESDMVIIQYAAYLFRKRAGEDTTMPRFLRLELNNMKISQKGKGNDV